MKPQGSNEYGFHGGNMNGTVSNADSYCLGGPTLTAKWLTTRRSMQKTSASPANTLATAQLGFSQFGSIKATEQNPDLKIDMERGLVTVPFWVYGMTSPYSSHYRPYT